MKQQQRHGLLPTENHDELARETFVRALKSHISTEVTPGVRELYTHRVLPRYQQEMGVPPRDRETVRRAMEPEPYYQLWSSVRRASQDLLWNVVADSIGRQLDDLRARAERTGRTLGSLELDPDFVLPWYFWGIDIHAMPGGYRGEYVPGDVTAGALYDRGVYVYAMGQMGELNDDYGQSVVNNYLKTVHKDFRPRRILEIGCGVGNSTLPYVDAYPEAEVHGIDVGAALLRYAHGRAESLGRKVHFAQRNGEDTGFPSGHFDLVVSHILLHEMPPEAVRAVLRECHRLLAPGGMMIHADFPGYAGLDPLVQFLIDWDTWNNNEPFWGPMRDMDLVQAARDAGFTGDCTELSCKRECVEEVSTPTGRVLQSGERRSSGTLALLVGRR
ncbi:class I SAM-dependent methyltransferase [Micromonospora sp. WMMC264]|uniref:class I SAM-dependent methyltransferase n=1 Tax=Micromonospora sp. WMMC264 TaxID=3015158 RepID=UPI00248C4722|nr:class I SAM-dependent methyltransferase [Micromonospora sp. WMMC264]WBB83100.1 class I SAM-dependent methyltransferase [Micromonospora sp. WMMC264]